MFSHHCFKKHCRKYCFSKDNSPDLRNNFFLCNMHCLLQRFTFNGIFPNFCGYGFSFYPNFSFQGMLIAVFYCFLNGEVQGEVKKFWKNIRLKNGLPSHSFRKGSSYHTNGTQFTGLVSSNSADDRSHAMQETSLLSPNGGACRSTSINSDTLQPPKQIYGQRAVLSDPQIKEEAV